MPGNLSRSAARERLAALGIRPRGLELDLAAAYVGLSPQLFLAEVEAGRYPRPSRHGQAESDKHKRAVWDRAALDDAMDKLNGRVPALPTPAAADPIMAKIHAAKATAKV